LLPYIILTLIIVGVFLLGAYGWDYTNSPEFCGTACHTMPPEYTAYLVSPHARVKCVECHIGRSFIATQISRKAGDIEHIVSLAFRRYEFPIRAKTMRPARESCERCHYPEKFSDDSLREIKRFRNDRDNTPYSIYLTLKTGGGSKRQGLGRGIHWHIENPVYYLALDPDEQLIPYVRVVNEDGSTTEYVDIGADINPAEIDPADLKEMDCITCHNRITHLIRPPEDVVDQLMARRAISPEIPEIHRKAIEALSTRYDSIAMAMNAIAGLAGYYQTYYPDFYAANRDQIEAAIAALQEAYRQSVFPEQKADWTTHVNEIGHKDSPGCFRCHDGKHLNEQQEAIRLECNLCHSVPVVVGPNDFVARIEISRGPEPKSHLHANWIAMHRDVFDNTCANCHTTEDAGGTSNVSFCSNSACHGTKWEYAGLDAPDLRRILAKQIPQIAPTPTPILAGSALTYNDTIGPLLRDRCGTCHGENGIQGLNLTTYEGLLRGGASGPAIVPGDPDNSLLVQRQQEEQPHFGQLTSEELELVIQWIEAGAPED